MISTKPVNPGPSPMEIHIVLSARSVATAIDSRTAGPTGQPHRHVAGITDAFQPLCSLHARPMAAAVFQCARSRPTFVKYRHIAVITRALGLGRREPERGGPLDDLSECPPTHPGQLTPDEVGQMCHMVTAPEYRQVPTRTLATLAQRLVGEKSSALARPATEPPLLPTHLDPNRLS